MVAQQDRVDELILLGVFTTCAASRLRIVCAPRLFRKDVFTTDRR
jgi:hypothetical protein